MNGPIRVAGMFSLVLGVAVSVLPARELSFDDRVASQKAIEQVYWNHRLWPKENPGPKPPLAAVMPDATIRAKVEDYLKKSNALEAWWQRPVTAAQLQAELDRMARDTRDGATLRELFAALGNDPFVIAETLGRQTLVDRLIRNWYANDARFHGELRTRAEASLAACGNLQCMKSMGGEYRETTWKLRAETSESLAGPISTVAIRLDAASLNDQLATLAVKLKAAADALPVGRLTGLEESPDGFTVSSVVSQHEGEVTTARVTWPKISFDAWWNGERAAIESSVPSSPGSVTLPSAALATCTNDTWAATRLDSVVGASDATAVWTGSEMIVWDGIGRRYNPATDTWTETSSGANAPEGRFYHTAVWTGTEMIVWGGFSQGSLNSGGRYRPSTDTWMPTAAVALVGRYSHTAVWTGTEMIVWGGGNQSVPFRTGGRYDPSANTWTLTSTGTDCPSARVEHSAVWTGSQMIVWGGANDFGLTSGARYDPSTDTWTATSQGPGCPAARVKHTAIWTGSEMIVWGGSSGGSLPDSGGRYNPTTNGWTGTSTGANVPTGRILHTAVWTGTEMIVWGGDDDSSFTNAGGRYNPATNGWSATSTGQNIPTGREKHTAVWTGTEMIVWGGQGEVTLRLNSGGRYSPATNSWVPTSTGMDVPSARQTHTAVWTGAEMIVWGGANASPLSSGGRYTPATNSWANTSIGANVPTGRYNHTAVWTGTEMIVWGGFRDSYVNTGGRYNPADDTWNPTSVGPGVPTGREQHTAVWTGTEMIVWGGYGGSYLNNGSRYRPSTNVWATTSTSTNVPAGRWGHASVWTGTEMIVWGGFNLAYPNTGGRYSPSTDSWMPTSNGANVPPGGYHATAVWTGAEMIVWGGYNGSYLNVGGRYRPATDSWTLTSTGANVPSPRNNHTAVWSGVEMIVWGGYGGVHLDTGGRYNASTDIWTPTSIGTNRPSARQIASGVWTGSALIVWGGTDGSPLNSGSRYCGCVASADSYRDVDGDGYGAAGQSVTSRNGVIPAGYVADATDCNDGNAQIHPAAPEINDGLDNQCPGEPGYGSIDDLSGIVGFFTAGDKTTLSWTAQPGASAYNVARSPFRDLHALCRGWSTTIPSLSDASVPPTGGTFFFLVRAGAPRFGSWGKRSSGVERSVCTGCDTVADPCDDLNLCTAGDNCSTGACVGSALDCDDGNPCTDDSCNPGSGCVHANNTSGCDDGNACTTDVCQSGSCVSTVPGAVNHLVISQVQVAGGFSGDEFIEIYNPTLSSIPLAGLSVQYRPPGGFSQFAVHPLGTGAVTQVPARGWFLVAPAGYDGPVAKDETVSAFSLDASAGVIALVTGTASLGISCPAGANLIDKVGYGALTSCAEGLSATAPSANDSIRRRPGGVCGNGTDTNSNSSDFVIQSLSTPRNSASPPQP